MKRVRHRSRFGEGLRAGGSGNRQRRNQVCVGRRLPELAEAHVDRLDVLQLRLLRDGVDDVPPGDSGTGSAPREGRVLIDDDCVVGKEPGKCCSIVGIGGGNNRIYEFKMGSGGGFGAATASAGANASKRKAAIVRTFTDPPGSGSFTNGFFTAPPAVLLTARTPKVHWSGRNKERRWHPR